MIVFNLKCKTCDYIFETWFSSSGEYNKQLRKKSVDDLLKLEASIYAIGGLAVGEPKEKMLEIVSLMNDLLPKNNPRYLMGVGTPIDLIKNVVLHLKP